MIAGIIVDSGFKSVALLKVSVGTIKPHNMCLQYEVHAIDVDN